MTQEVKQTLADWVATEGEARLILSDDLRPQWVSPAAERLLSDANSVLYCNGRIRPRSPNVDGELRSFLSEATAAGATHCLTDSRTGEHIVVTATRLGEAVAITLRSPEHGGPVKLVDLHRAFGFTAAELAVAERLLNGSTAEEAACQLGVSLETIRTHIKRAYAKLEVSSREAFFHKLRDFVIRL